MAAKKKSQPAPSCTCGACTSLTEYIQDYSAIPLAEAAHLMNTQDEAQILMSFDAYFQDRNIETLFQIMIYINRIRNYTMPQFLKEISSIACYDSSINLDYQKAEVSDNFYVNKAISSFLTYCETKSSSSASLSILYLLQEAWKSENRKVNVSELVQDFKYEEEKDAPKEGSDGK